jgi:hypothetical protein
MVYAAPGGPVPLSAPWRTWLGELRSEQIERSNFLLEASRPSARPAVLDAENEELKATVNFVFHGLLLQGVPGYRRGFYLTGANVEGEVCVRELGDLPQYAPSPDLGLTVGATELQRAFTLGLSLKEIDAGKPRWARLRAGLRALWRGSQETDSGERLHQFVRALEALVKPEVGKTRRQFVQRLEILTCPEAGPALGQMYMIRNKVEHLHDPLAGLPCEQADEILRQADRLVRLAYQRVVERSELLQMFVDDNAIDALWARPASELRSLWGPPIALSAGPEAESAPL